jgi:hypothetical protein
VIVGGAFPHCRETRDPLWRRLGSERQSPAVRDVIEFLPQYRQMAIEAGRHLASIPVSIFGAPEDLDRLKRYRDQGIACAVVSLPSVRADEVLPILDRWGSLILRTQH